MKLAIALHLSLDAIEQITLKFLNFAATEASHVHVIALWTALVKVPVTLEVHQVKLIHQPLALQEAQRPIYGHAIYIGVYPDGLTKDLRSVQVLLGSLDNLQNDTTLSRHANSAAQ
jgi:hypothetical protein